MSYSTPILILILQTCNDESHDGSSWSPEGREHHLQDESPGILSSLKRSLCWPLHVCAVPWRVFNWLHGKACATGVHLRDNAEDYAFLYELLSVSLPLLAVLHEQLVQMYAEAEPLNLQPLQLWLEEHMGHWVLMWEKHLQGPLKGIIWTIWTYFFRAYNWNGLVWIGLRTNYQSLSQSQRFA